MRILATTICVLGFSIFTSAQNEGKWLRAFPITDYIVELNDSVKVVQLEMPENFRIPDKQLAIAYGVYETSAADAVQKGYGRCHLVKSVYHYFSIGHNESGIPLKAGDLLYMFLDSTNIYYGRIPRLASHFIRLKDVYDNPFYDRYLVFNKWTPDDEQLAIDSMLADIRFTGNWMKENNSTQDIKVESGRYANRTVFEVMINCREQDLIDFLEYVLANPRNYAGGNWKATETFATWVTRVQ